MPNINLILQKRQEKSRLESGVRRLFFLMSGLFILAILLFVIISTQWFRLKNQSRDLEAELAKLQPTIAEIKDYEDKTKALQPRIELYGKARDHTKRWYSVLQVVARSLPESCWLTKINSRQEPESKDGPPDASVTINGITMSQKLVGDAMLTLNNYPDLMKKVSLGYTRENNSGAIPAVEFEITAEIEKLPAYFIDQPPVKTQATAEASGGATSGNQSKS